MSRRGSCFFHGVVWLMVGLTIQLGFAQTGAPTVLDSAPSISPPITVAIDHSPPPPPVEWGTGSAAGEPPLTTGSPVFERGPADWLSSTVDANHEDRFIQEKLAGIGLGVTNAFSFVRDQIGYEAYEGSLRGARGTMWSAAGSSLDQASLLIALLRGQGIGARYVRGTLSTTDARVLIRSMFDPVVAASAAGYIPERFPLYDPETDPGLLRWSVDHWWVELENGTQLDPCFSDAVIGETRGTASATFYEVPDALRHKVVVRLKAELHNMLSQYSYQTPLEVTFSTPEVYGKAITLGHFISVYQPPALVTGFKTYTYSPYLMVDDNDADWGNNHVIRGTDYQEFLTGLFPMANSTLTRLTLEFEVCDPGKAPDMRTRDILDRVGYAARKGLAQPGSVDTSQPALTELDLTTFFVTPGFIAPDVVPPHQAILSALDSEMTTLGQTMSSLTNKPATALTASDQAAANRYTTLNRAAVIAGGSVVAGAFLLDSDYHLRQMRDAHRVHAYYNTPRITLFETHTGVTDTSPTLRAGLDLRRNHVLAVPYPGQNAFDFFAFNMAKGRVDSALEHLTVEHFLAKQHPEVRRVASPMKVLQEAKTQGVRIEVLRGEADISTRLEPLPLSAEAKARISDALRSGHAVNVPAQMITVDGQPSIGWWQIDLRTGEVIAVGEDGGNQNVIEFAIIMTLVVFASLFVLMIFGGKIQTMFAGNDRVQTYDPTGFAPFESQPNQVTGMLRSTPATELPYSGDVVNNADGSATIRVDGQQVTLSSDVLNEINIVFEAVGASGSVVDWVGTDIEVIFNFAPGSLSQTNNPTTAGADFSFSTGSETSFVVKQDENQLPTAYRITIANGGLPDPGNLTAYRSRTNESFLFQVTGNTTNRIWGTDTYTDTSPLATAAVHAGVLTNGQTGTVKVTPLPSQGYYPGSYRNGVNSITYSAWNTGGYRFETLDPVTDASAFLVGGQAPAGWQLLFSRTNTTIPPGVSGELSAFLQLAETNALPAPGAAVDFTLAVNGGRSDPTAVVAQQVHFVMPEIHGLMLIGTPDTVYSSPNGTNTAELVVLNTGNVDETVTLTLPEPDGFDLQGLDSPIVLGPGLSVTQTVTFAALNVAVDTDHYTTLTAQFGPTNSLTKALELHVHVAVPGALEALQAANDARAIGRTALAETLATLGQAISQLYGDPTNAVQRSRVLANLTALAGQLDDPLLSPFAAGLLAAHGQLAAAADDQVAAALETLGTEMRGFTEFLQVLAQHDFELALQPNTAQTLPETPTTFGLYLRNKGRQTTTYTLALSALPAGISGGLDRTNLTLAPGQAASPSLAVAEKVNVILTQPAHELTAFDFTVTATVDGAEEITRTANGAFAARKELVEVMAVVAEPPFVEPMLVGTKIGIFTGGDTDEGLDLDGEFRYAFNVGAPGAAGQIRNANFTADNIPGVTVSSTGQSPTWFAANYGNSTNDDRLEFVMQSCRWTYSPTPLTVSLAGTEPGRHYRLQLLFAEGYSDARAFDVFVEGQQIADGFSPGAAVGGANVLTRGAVITHDFVAQDTTLNVVLGGASTDGNPFLSGVTLEALPPVKTALSVRLLNAINADRDVLLQYTVRDAARAAVFTSSPQPARLSVLSSLDTFPLGDLDTSALPLGCYTVEVSVHEEDGQAIPGAAGTGTLLVGSPINASLTGTPTERPPGNGPVDVTLNVSSQIEYGPNGAALIGLRDTVGNAWSLAVRDGYAHIGGSENVTVMDISNPRDPRIVHTFGTPGTYGNHTALGGDYLLVSHDLDLNVFALTNPAQPSQVASVVGGVSGTYGPGLMLHDSIGLIPTLVYMWSGSQIVGIRGDALLFDVANPLVPVAHGLFYNTPQSFHPEWPGSNFYIGRGTAALGDTLYLPSTTVPNDARDGTGLVRMLTGTAASNLVEIAGCEIPGTTVLHGVGIQGDRALVTGSTGYFTVQGSPRPTGDLSLHLLDLSDPHNPVVLSGTNLSGVDTSSQASVVPAPVANGLYAVQGITMGGQAMLLLVDASDPSTMTWKQIEVPSASRDVVYQNGLLFTASNDGLGIYDLGGLLGVPVTARVRVPNDGSTVLATNSFNLPPDQIIPGTDYDTLVWQLTLSSALTNKVFTWQMDVGDLQPGEAREVAYGGTVDFTAWGTESSIELPPLSVAGAHILTLNPSHQNAQPGETANYVLTLTNTADVALTYGLAVQGVPDSWVALAPSVVVPAQEQAEVLLTLKPATSATLGDHSYAVLAEAPGGPADSVYGTLTLAGPPLVPDAAGVVISLSPPRATAGQGTPAEYAVRLVNTGNASDAYALTAQVPAGFIAQFDRPNVEVPPGRDNYREVLLTVTPQPGTAAGDQAFTVTAASTTDATVQHQVAGTVSVSSAGVALGWSPASGSPGSSFTLAITNTGQQAQTFDLALGGSASLSATLPLTVLTLGPSGRQTLSVNVSNLDYGYPGDLLLTALATARSNTNVQAQATASIEVPTAHGVTASFEPAVVGVPRPGPTHALLVIRNSGNSEDTFTARVAGVSGAVSASLVGVTNQLVQQTGALRLPGLASGAVLLQATMTQPGTGTVQVVVSSLEHSNVTALATLEVRCGVWLGMTEEWIIEMSFDPEPSVDYFFEYRDAVPPGQLWQELPGGPFNRGLYYLCLPANCDRFNLTLPDPQGLFVDYGNRAERYYRLRASGGPAPRLVGRVMRASMLEFDPLPGFDHTVQYADELGTADSWHSLPRGPHNAGLAFDPRTQTQRFYRVLITQP